MSAGIQPIGPERPNEPRPPWILLGLLIYLVHLAAALAGAPLAANQPSGGLEPHVAPFGNDVHLIPHTAVALHAAGAADLRRARVVRINGSLACEGPCHRRRVRGLVSRNPGTFNTFELRYPDGRSEVLRTEAGPSELPFILRSCGIDLPLTLLGLFNVCASLLIWIRRPRDPGARALLWVGLTLGVLLNANWPSPYGVLLAMEHAFVAPFGAAVLRLSRVFTRPGHRSGPLEGWLHRLAIVLAGLGFATTLAAGAELSGGPASAILLLRVSMLFTTACLIGSMVETWRSTRRPHPLGVRRRASVMGSALVLGLGFPTFYGLCIVWFPYLLGAWIQLPILLSFVAFPVLLGYAIVSRRVFDLRIVLRQGLVYGGLSLILSLIYLAVVLGALSMLRQKADYASSPGFLAASVLALVLLFSLLKVKAQRAVDRLVFRNRDAYRLAISRASDALVGARRLSDVAGVLASPLSGAMGLTRAYLVIPPAPDTDLWTSFCLGNQPDPETEERWRELPSRFRQGELQGLNRAIASKQTVAAYDAEATTADGSLWQRYGLESATPLSVGREDGGRRLVGLLLLGPKRNGRPLDGEDTELVHTLGNQTAIAIENAIAFEEIRQLKDGLEDKVEARTRELREAQSRLVESEKEVLLGRLVAGVVHEINTPLGALRSSAQTVQRALSGAREIIDSGERNDQMLKKRLEAGEQLVANIDASSRRIDRLVQSLKGFANLDEASLRVVNLEHNIDSVLGLMGPSLGNTVRVDRDLETELRCECYPARFNQALANLLQNAIDAGASNLRIAGKKVDGQLRIEVVDDGRGIAPERLERIFDFGFAEKRSEGRMGLSMGLPYAKRTVEEVRGSLALSSKLGQGTTARITLPHWFK